MYFYDFVSVLVWGTLGGLLGGLLASAVKRSVKWLRRKCRQMSSWRSKSWQFLSITEGVPDLIITLHRDAPPYRYRCSVERVEGWADSFDTVSYETVAALNCSIKDDWHVDFGHVDPSDEWIMWRVLDLGRAIRKGDWLP